MIQQPEDAPADCKTATHFMAHCSGAMRSLSNSGLVHTPAVVTCEHIRPVGGEEGGIGGCGFGSSGDGGGGGDSHGHVGAPYDKSTKPAARACCPVRL